MITHPSNEANLEKLYREQEQIVDDIRTQKEETPGCTCVIVPINQGTEDFQVQTWTERCRVHGWVL